MPLQPVSGRGRPSRANATARNNAMMPVAAPVGGLNFRDAYMVMPPTDATILTNVVARANGLELRGGWREYATGLADGDDTVVRCVMPYHAPNPNDDRLFAAVGEKVYDVTAGGSAPPVAFTVSGGNGHWHFVQFSNSSASYLCAVGRGSAGYWTYDSVGGWVDRTTLLTGRPSANITGIFIWKRRLWFTFANNSRAYYLPIEAIQGSLSAFDFGPQMKHGGSIASMATFTQDGADSIQDYLAVFGSEGDVIVYAGYDPTNADNFQLVGAWYVGRFPSGAEFVTKVGSDVYALCEGGIVPLSMLVGGRWTDSVINNPITGKIQNVLGPAVVGSRNSAPDFWQAIVLPNLDILMLKEPTTAVGVDRQWVMNTTTGAWSVFTGLPMRYVTSLRGKTVFGTADGRVALALSDDEETDGELLDGTAGQIIEGDVQGAFYDFGQPGVQKNFQLARTIINSNDAPSVAIRMNTQFSFNAIPGSPEYVAPAGARWDASLWNQAQWAGSVSTFEAWSGLSGFGYYGALRVQMRGRPGTIYTGAIVNLQAGGPM